MSSFKDLIKNATKEEEDKKKHSSFVEIIRKANASLKSDLTQDDITNWSNSVRDVSQRAYSYLSSEGYKKPDTKLAEDVDKYLSEAGEISVYLRTNKNSYKDYENVYDAYVQYVNGLKSFRDNLKNSNDFFSQFETEKDYEDWKIGWLQPDAETNEETATARKNRYTQNQTRISEIDKQLEALKKDGFTTEYERGSRKSVVKYRNQNEITALTTEKETLQAENNRYKREQKVLDDYYTPVTPEFLANGADRNYTNASRDELWEVNANHDHISNLLSSGTYKWDDDGNIVNVYTDKIEYAADDLSRAMLKNAESSDPFNGGIFDNDPSDNFIDQYYDTLVQDPLGMFFSASEDDIADAYHEATMDRDGDHIWANILVEGDSNAWKELEEHEINIYYNLLKTQGEAAAYKFLKDMTVELTRRATLARQTEIDNASGLELAWKNIESIPGNVFGGVADFISDAISIMSGQEINPYSNAHAWQNDAQYVRQVTADRIDTATGNAALPWLGTTWGDAYQALMSAGDTTLGLAVGPKAYGRFMGMGAASQEMKRLYEIGASADQIATAGLLAGAAEMVFETLSIGALLDLESPQTMKQVLKNFFKQGWIEASEEMATEISNTITNAIVMGSQSDWVDAETFVKKVLNSGIGGFISGGFMGGGGSLVQYAGNQIQNIEKGRSIMDAEGGVDALRTIALDRIQNSSDKTRNEISKLSDKVSGEKVKASNVGRLYKATMDAATEQNKADIIKSLERKGYSAKEAASFADILATYFTGENITRKQYKKVESLMNDENFLKTVNDVVLNEDSTVGQRTADLSMFDMGIAYGVGVSPNVSQTQKNFAEKSLKNEAAKILEEKKIEVADDGKTTNLKTNKAVEIKNIESISESGEANLTLDDGMVVKASDVAFGSEAEAIFVSSIGSIKLGKKNISTASANALYQNALTALKANPNMTATEAMSLIKGLEESYIYGAYNLSREKLSSKNKDGSATMFAGELTQSQRDSAYELGSQDKVSKVETDQKVIDDLKAKGKANKDTPSKTTAKKGKVRFEDGVAAKSKLQKKTVSLAKHLARAIGVDIVFYDARTTRNSDVKDANGYYDVETDTIYLDLQNSHDDAKTIAFTLSHELVHFIKKWSPKKFNTLAKFLMEQYTEHGVDSSRLLANKMAELGTEDAEFAYEEMICDACETMLLDSNAVYKLMELRKTDLELFDKIKLFVYELLNKIRNMYKSLGLAPTSDEAKALLGMEDVLEQMYSLFEEAAVDAVQSYQAVSTLETESASVSEDGTAFVGEFTKRSYTSEQAELLSDLPVEALQNAADVTGALSFNMIGLGSDKTTQQKWIDAGLTYTEEGNVYVDENALLDERDRRRSLLKTSRVSQSVQNSNETVFGEESVDVGKTESGVKNQLKNHKKIGEDAVAYNERHKNVHKAILQAGIESMYEMAEVMLPYLEEDGILPPDIPGKTIFKNGSYGRTGENTTLCVRTLTYEDFKDRVAEKVGRPLTVSESLLVSQKIYDIATEPQCIYCYVAADRKAYDGYLGEYWKAMDKYIKAMRNGGDSQALYTEYLAGRKDTTQQKKRWSQWEAIAKSGKEYISAKDLTTKRKRDALIAKKNAFSEQIKDAQRYAQSASWAKTVFDYRAYKGDILKMTSNFVDMLNSEYGLRMYSFSDYTPAFIVENMQMIIDASVKGLKSLAYTKDTDYAEIFASTGQAINVSCFAKWDAESGTYVEDNRQGANWEKTKSLRNQYRNVGAVMVATNDAMVEWALKQDWVDVVIPYHIVKTGTTIANEYQWNNYTSESADRVGNKTANIYPTEHNNDFATYSNLLKGRGITPRFSRWYDKVAIGELTEAQYMKLVNEVRLPASELSAVTPNFNLDAAKNSFGVDNEGNVIKSGFVDKGGYMGGWYRQGVDVNQEVMAVSEDIKAGKSSLDVDYGMSKATKEKVEEKYKPSVKKQAKPSKKNPELLDPRTVTEKDVTEMLENATFGEYDDGTYIPLRRNTPEFFIGVVKEHSKGTYAIEDYPIAATVEHLRQNMEEEDGRSYGEERPHELSVDDIITISKKMGDPSYIVLQKNGRYAEVVSFYNKQNKQVIVVVDMADSQTNPPKNFKYSQYMNGYDEGYYNIVVTQYEPDDLQDYLSKNEVVYDKKEMNGKYQVGSGRIVTVTHDTPFIEESIPQEGAESQGKAVKKQLKKDSFGKELSNGQQKYFAKSKVRDRYGNLLRLFHGSDQGGFTIFDPKKSDDALCLFLTDTIEMAESYSGSRKPIRTPSPKPNILRWLDGGTKKAGKQQGVYEVYANITNPMIIEAKGRNFNQLSVDAPNTKDVNLKVAGYENDMRIEITIGKENYVEYFYNFDEAMNFVARKLDKGERSRLKAAFFKGGFINIDTNFKWDTERNQRVPYLDIRDIAKIAKERGHDGVIVRDVTDYDNRYGIPEKTPHGTVVVAFKSNQIKDVHNTNPTKSKDIRYQKKKPTNRSILANSLESAAQNDIERNKLAQYKEKISLIESEEQRLSEIQKQLFTKGGVDPAQRKELQFEAKQISNRINTYDRQLLNLEATTALKNVLSREKALAMKRQKQKDAEALRQYKEKVAKTTRELMDRHQESRKKAIEGREKTAMRHKIQKVVSELNQLLLRGTKDKHVMIGLQKVVAEALDAVNMDTVGADERVAHYNDLIAKAKDPDVIASLTETRDRIQQQGDKMSDKLTKLKNAYNDIKNSDDPLIANSYDEVISSRLDYIAEKVGNTPLRDMSLEQLEDVYDMYKMVLTTIRNSNKSFKNAKKESIAALGNRVMMEVEKIGGNKKYVRSVLQGIKKFGWNSLKPIYAFRVIGSNTFTDIFNTVRAGEDTWAVDVSEAKDFYQEKTKKYNYNSWDFKQKHSFESATGKSFDLTLEQIMSLYAYSKREQADLHLRYGGFVFDSSIEVTEKSKLGIPMKYKVNTAEAYNLSAVTLGEIVETLTDEQKAFVDEMQSYLSDVMGEKGNEVSLEMYGVKLFKEDNYFPLKSANQFMFEQNEVAGEVKIKNSGFSKETVPKANNPIILNNFTDVWANHVNDMSMYHSFVLPLEDFNRVLNYKTPASDSLASESVKMFLQNAYGEQATQYIKQLLTDLNGGARVDSSADWINKSIGLFKKAGVFASASVVIQQPSALARAWAYINPKYFVFTKMGIKDHRNVWNEVKKYAPVAVIKEMGRFDTHIGRQTTEWIKSNQYEGINQKTKALVTDSAYRDDLLSRAPALADEIAWCYIWNAVKKETKATTNLKEGSEEFLKKCGERFTEVITHTQVYDSVLSRSGHMRSKDTGMKMATAFMAEPTTAMNMALDAHIQSKRGNKKAARQIVGGVVASVILNSILVSIVYAARDDDEDETYAEKYLGSLTTELIDGFNPLTYIPFVKDLWSIGQGYDVERSDMSIYSNLWQSVENLFNEDMSGTDKALDFAGSVANIFGLPLKNIVRDTRAIGNVTKGILSGTQTTGAGIGYALQDAIRNSVPLVGRFFKEDSNSTKLYDAIVSGDQVQIDRIKKLFKDDKAIESAMRKALRENDPRIKEAAEARIDGDIAEYTRIVKAIKGEGNFVQDTIVAAVNAEINALNKGEDSSSSSDKTKSMYTMDDYYMALDGGDEATAYVVKEDLIETDVANGKDREEAEESFISKFTSHLREQYEEGGISDYEAQRMLVDYGDKTEEEAASKVQYWDFKQEYPDYDDLSEEAVAQYYDEVEPHGIDVDVYYDYSKQRSKCKGVDANGDGKTDSGSVKSEVLWVIHSLPLTYAQKDALYYLNGWSAKTIYEAPWH